MLIGMVGKPNVGKSTFFSAATLIPVPIANRPFTTIKPNRGIAYVRSSCVCHEFGVCDNPRQSVCIDGVRLIPIELVDCAGLVPDAWQGRGLGNFFLDEIRKADALIHIIDVAGATDAEGRQCTPGSQDPLKDVQFLEHELTMWLVQILQKDWRRLSQSIATIRGNLVEELCNKLSGLAIPKSAIAEAIRKSRLDPDRPNEWRTEDLRIFANHLRQLAKPMLIAANKIDLSISSQNIQRLQQTDYIVIPCSAEAELILRRAANQDLISYRPGDSTFQFKQPNKLTKQQQQVLNTIENQIFARWETTGIQSALNRAFYDLLKMITVYPVENIERLSDHKGNILPDAFLVPTGTTAKEFAYMIHSDLGTGFLYAIDARTHKRLGEEYVIADRDVIKIVSTQGRK
jgi:ribosome-binding ATPase YchF (GTP1/OBG family)